MYQFKYKCRLCGQTFTVSGEQYVRPREQIPFGNSKTESIMKLSAKPQHLHDCTGPYAGCIGVADLQGALPLKQGI